jgi:cytochrome c
MVDRHRSAAANGARLQKTPQGEASGRRKQHHIGRVRNRGKREEPHAPSVPTPSPLPFLAALPLALAALLMGSSEGLAAGDVSAGQAAFSRCAACHSTTAGVNKIGPSLAGIVGSKSGPVPGSAFSPPLKEANITWDDGTLDKFLQNPNGLVHGTRMFVSVPNPTDRQNIIAYLHTLTR